MPEMSEGRKKMSKLLKNTLALICIGIFMSPYRAGAISKLDFTVGPADWGSKVEMLKTIADQKVQAALQQMSKILKQPSVGEGKFLGLSINSDVDKKMGGLISYLNPNNVRAILDGNISVNGVVAQVLPLITKNKQQLANTISDYNSLMLALQQEKAAKDKKILEQLVDLRAKLKITTKEDERIEIEQQIAVLEGQREANSLELISENPELRAKRSRIHELSKIVGDAEAMLQQNVMEAKGAEMVTNLFDKEITDAEEADLYSEKLGDLFLKANEDRSSENVQRVRLTREREYYYAMLNLFKTTMDNNIRSVEIEQKNIEMTDASMQTADGLYGSKTMQIGVDVQMAKNAAYMTTMLLGEIRYNALKEMKQWNNKFKLVDYSHDVTVLDLDYYNMLDDDISNIENLYDGLTDGIGSSTNNFQKLWHGF